MSIDRYHGESLFIFQLLRHLNGHNLSDNVSRNMNCKDLSDKFCLEISRLTQGIKGQDPPENYDISIERLFNFNTTNNAFTQTRRLRPSLM